MTLRGGTVVDGQPSFGWRHKRVEENGINRLPTESLRTSDFSKIIRQRTAAVKGFLLFSGIPEEDCANILATARERTYPAGKTMFFEGDPVRQVVVLTAGCVKLSQSGPQGREVILRLVGPGESLCAECFPKYHHCSTGQTMKESSAFVWEAHQFEAVAHKYPALERNISGVILRTLNQLEVRFREISTEKVAPRLSSQLVRLVNQLGQRVNGHVEIRLSQRDLAQLTGTTLFTVSRLLGQWEAQGFVRPQRQGVLVLNMQALEDLAQSD